MIRSLLKLSVTTVLTLALAFIVAGTASYYLLAHQHRWQERGNEIALARYIGETLGEYVSDQHRALTKFAQQPSVVLALQSDRLSDRQRKGEDLSAAFPDSTHVYVVRYDSAESNGLNPEYPALLQRIARTGERKVDEFHAGTASDAHVDIVQPVYFPSGNELLGALIVKIPVAGIQQRIAAFAAPQRFIELRQTSLIGEREIFATAGERPADGGPQPLVFPVPNTPWEVVLADTGASTPIFGMRLGGLAAFIIAILLAALAVTAALLYRLNRAARHDINSLVRMFHDIRQGSVRVDYPMELKEFNSVFAYLRDSGRQLVKQQQKFRDLGLIDHLSQLNNRRAFEQRLAELFKQSTTHSPSSVLMIDLDHFKNVNDRRGHDSGDALIVNFSQALKQRVRASDFLARLGGDEFCIIFAYTPLRQADLLVKRLREELPRTVALLKGHEHSLRWTGGLSGMDPEDTKFDQVLWRADQALLRAKESGRNQTYVYHPEAGLQTQ